MSFSGLCFSAPFILRLLNMCPLIEQQMSRQVEKSRFRLIIESLSHSMPSRSVSFTNHNLGWKLERTSFPFCTSKILVSNNEYIVLVSLGTCIPPLLQNSAILSLLLRMPSSRNAGLCLTLLSSSPKSPKARGTVSIASKFREYVRPTANSTLQPSETSCSPYIKSFNNSLAISFCLPYFIDNLIHYLVPSE